QPLGVVARERPVVLVQMIEDAEFHWAEPSKVPLNLLQARREEELLDPRLLLDHALRVLVAQNGLERLAVRFEPVPPRVGAERLLLLAQDLRRPGEREVARVLHVAVAELLRLLERLQHAYRDPWMALEDLVLDHHRVHDREDPAAFV